MLYSQSFKTVSSPKEIKTKSRNHLKLLILSITLFKLTQTITTSRNFTLDPGSVPTVELSPDEYIFSVLARLFIRDLSYIKILSRPRLSFRM